MRAGAPVKKQGAAGGFTLIEMAVVLLLLGIVAGGGLVGFSGMTQKMKIGATKEKFSLIEAALSSYAQRYKRLPCPAAPDGGGVERSNGRCFSNTTASALYASMQGTVPWRELGLPESAVRDGWGRFITYKPAPQLTVNHVALEMQNMDTGTSALDVHDACRSALWFSEKDGGSYKFEDRAKAMFCCNVPPRNAYLSAYQSGGGLPAGWRDQAVLAAGQLSGVTLNAASAMPADRPLQSTNAWLDSSDLPDLNGDFDVPDHGDAANVSPDAPMSRATGLAVTLISHGGNGFLSFLSGKAENLRLQASLTGGGITGGASASGDERLNVWPPQVVAAATYNPKAAAGAFDPMGIRNGASDDQASYLRSDQLFAYAGTATCLRPAITKPMKSVCPPSGLYGDVTYFLDTSGSMTTGFNGGSLGSTRIEVAKNALKLVIPEHIEQEVKEDTEDPDKVGFNRFNSAAPGYGCGVLYDDKTGIYTAGFDSNGDGVVDDTDQVTPATLEAAKDNMINTISSISAWGNTPIAQSIRVTADAMASATGENGTAEEPNAIVFISDGQDTCGGDIVATAHYIAEKYPNLAVHIVDVANNPLLAQMHEKFIGTDGQEHQMKGKYIKADDGEDVIKNLMTLSGQCDNT